MSAVKSFVILCLVASVAIYAQVEEGTFDDEDFNAEVSESGASLPAVEKMGVVSPSVSAAFITGDDSEDKTPIESQAPASMEPMEDGDLNEQLASREIAENDMLAESPDASEEMEIDPDSAPALNNKFLATVLSCAVVFVGYALL